MSERVMTAEEIDAVLNAQRLVEIFRSWRDVGASDADAIILCVDGFGRPLLLHVAPEGSA